MFRLSPLLLGLALSSTAHALPTTLTHQGRLLDADGRPVDGLHAFDFELYQCGRVLASPGIHGLAFAPAPFTAVDVGRNGSRWHSAKSVGMEWRITAASSTSPMTALP